MFRLTTFKDLLSNPPIYHVLISTLLWKMTLHKDNPPETFYRLSSAILQEKMGTRQFYVILKQLLADGVVECDKKYHTGIRSKGYRISSKWYNKPRTEVKVDGALGKRLKAYQKVWQNDMKQRINGTNYKQCVADLKTVRINWKHINWDGIWDTIKRTHKDKAYTNGPEHRLECTKAIGRNIYHRHFDYSVCDYGRLHTPITSLSNLLLPYITLDGNSVCSVDITNSQPLFLILKLRAELDKTTEKIEVCEKSRGIQPHTHHQQPPTLPLCTVKIAYKTRNTSIFPEDSACSKNLENCFGRLRDLVSSGNFYEAIADYAGVSRSKAKILFYVYAYGPIKYVNKCTLFFQSNFPAMYELIRRIKIDNKLPDGELTSKGKPAIWAYLARAMQKQESNFIFNRVIPRVRQEIGCRLLTKHDSLLIANQHTKKVSDIIKDEFAKLGIVAQTTTTVHRPAVSPPQIHSDGFYLDKPISTLEF